MLFDQLDIVLQQQHQQLLQYGFLQHTILKDNVELQFELNDKYTSYSSGELNSITHQHRIIVIRDEFHLLNHLCYTADIDAVQPHMHTRLKLQIYKNRNLLPATLYRLIELTELTDIHDTVKQLNQYLQQHDMYSFHQYDDDIDSVYTEEYSDNETAISPSKTPKNNNIGSATNGFVQPHIMFIE